jgi:hypothetical protein
MYTHWLNLKLTNWNELIWFVIHWLIDKRLKRLIKTTNVNVMKKQCDSAAQPTFGRINAKNTNTQAHGLHGTFCAHCSLTLCHSSRAQSIHFMDNTWILSSSAVKALLSLQKCLSHSVKSSDHLYWLASLRTDSESQTTFRSETKSPCIMAKTMKTWHFYDQRGKYKSS